MKPIPLGFRMLNLDRKSHHYSSTQPDSLVNEFNGAEFDITDTATYI